MFKRLMAILNLVTFFIHFNLALGKCARYKLLNQFVTRLTTMCLAVAFLLIYKRHLIQLSFHSFI